MQTRIRLTRFALLLMASAYAASAIASSSTGRTPGHFAVSPMGSAQYSIPIFTPPGVHGIQPRLALAYDSRLGYGLMGPGWTLTGLSAISRCNPTYAQDAAPAPITLTTADGLCLDGNRLRTTSTGVYQTEIANFSQVTASGTAGNGPAYFTVQGKDGLTYEYGNTTDSQVLPCNSGCATPYIWALDKVTDRVGNQMTFTYFQSGGAYVPLSIQYTAPSGSTTFPYQVNFGYTTKSANDLLTTYVAGTEVQQSEQLQTITVTSSGTTVREYYLSYQTSTATLRATLYAIEECGGSAGTDCLLPTTVGYQYGTAGVASPTTSTGSGTANGAVYSVDLNGDGRKDLIYAVTVNGNYQWYAQISNGAGYGTPLSTGLTTVGTTDFLLDDFDGGGMTEILGPSNLSGAATFQAYKWNGSCTGSTTTGCFTITSTGVSIVTGALYASADVDGDGRSDIVSLTLSGGIATVASQISTSGSGTFSFAASTNPFTFQGGASLSLVGFYGNNQLEGSSIKHMDFDGDGRQDILYTQLVAKIGYTVQPILSRGTAGFSLGVGYNSTDGKMLPVNWNDDACTDFVDKAGVLLISPCNGGAEAIISLPAAPSIALDWDGDGRTDVLAYVNNTWEVFRSEGTTYAAGVSAGITTANSGVYVVTDNNGDGLDDLAYAAANSAIYYGVHNGAYTRPDLAISFVDGFGNGVFPVYAAITQPGTAYTALNDQSFPYQNYVGPLYVTWQVAFTDPSTTGGEYAWDLDYQGASLNLQGRGFVGFGVMQKYDTRTGLFESSGYSRSFPTIGMRTYDIIFTDKTLAQAVTDTSATLASITLDSTANNQRYFPYLSNTLKSEYEVGGAENGQLSKTTASAYTYDNYGNATTIATTITDDDSTSPYNGDQYVSTVTNTITPNLADWCLYLPTQTTVTNSSNAPDGTAITRTVQYTPDYAHCWQNVKITEPNSSLYKVTETYSHDTFGNVSGDAVLGVNMAVRNTTINWGANGQFPTVIINPLMQSITLGFDPKTGMKTSQTDPNYTSSNPIQTTWMYDDFGRMTQETRLDGTYTVWQYNNCATNGGCLFGTNALAVSATVYNVGGSIQSQGTTYYDTVDRAIMSTAQLSSGYSRSEVRYDSVGRIAQQAMPCLYSAVTTACPYWTTVLYDVRNRPTQSQRPISATMSTQYQTTYYGYAGRTSTVEDALTNTTTKITTVTGSLARSQDAKGYYQNLTYDSFGALKLVTDSASNTLFTANYAYGLGAFQTSSTDMDLGARSYTIDALGEVTAYSDGNSQNFSFMYDALSRPTSRTEHELTTNWTWGATASLYNIGKLQSVTGASSAGTYTENFGYDSKTRLSTDYKSLPGDASYTYTWTYNPTTGLPSTLQYPVSTSSYQLSLQYGYTNGILSSITDTQAGTVYWTANTTTPRGQVTKETLGNGVVTNRVFDAVTGWVRSIQSGVSGGYGLQNNSFQYDELGDVQQRQDNNQTLTENFYYDTDYRLDHSTLNGTLNLQMTYDSGAAGPGNITARSDVAGGTSWTYDPVRKHAVTQAGTGGYSYTYDGNGNAVSRNGSLIGWTSYNYPSSVASSGESATFQYGPDRQRWKTIYTGSIGTETTYHVGKLLEKVANGGTLDYRHYIFAGSELVGIYSRLSSGTNTMRYVLGDHQSSFSSILSSTGTADVSESFAAFGNRRSGEKPWSGAPTTVDENTINGISRQGYTGQTALGVSMGLIHMNGRVEDAITGRFLSPDPTIPDPGNTQSFNRYSYVNNNPLSYTDPSGFDETGLPELIVTAGGGPENPYTDVLAGAVEILSDFGLGSLFGGGGPTLSPSQQAAVHHGINLSDQLPSINVTGVRFADSTLASQFFSPFSVGAMAATAGVDPDMIKNERVGYTSPQSSNDPNPGEIHVTADAIHGFNWLNLFPGWSALVCGYYGCGAGNWAMAGIGAIPFGSVESATARGGLAAVRAGQAGEAAVRAAYDIGPKTAINIAGRTRIPDGLLKDALSEVKNVQSLSYTQQLRDFTQFSLDNGLRFDLYVRPGAELSGPLQDAIDSGFINRLYIPQ